MVSRSLPRLLLTRRDGGVVLFIALFMAVARVLAVLRRARLSARDAVADRIRGLNLGADDYLPKPFSIDELVSRLLLPRQAGVKTTVLAHRGIRVDLLSRTVTFNGAAVELRG